MEGQLSRRQPASVAHLYPGTWPTCKFIRAFGDDLPDVVGTSAVSTLSVGSPQRRRSGDFTTPSAVFMIASPVSV